MKKLKMGLFVSLYALCTIVINGCKKDSAISSEPQATIEKANLLRTVDTKQSGGNITVAGGGTTLEFGEKTTYAFNAVQSNGKTTGHLILKFRAADGALFIKVDCLRLFGDNKATLSGIITQFKESPQFPAPPFIYLGARVSFTVQDNGEGRSSSADLVSDIGVLDINIPASCADDMIPYLPLDGNVQINK